jgi:hypothetical protein
MLLPLIIIVPLGAGVAQNFRDRGLRPRSRKDSAQPTTFAAEAFGFADEVVAAPRTKETIMIRESNTTFKGGEVQQMCLKVEKLRGTADVLGSRPARLMDRYPVCGRL